MTDNNRADFYIGRGIDAEYIGTVFGPRARPDVVDPHRRFVVTKHGAKFSELMFRMSVRSLLMIQPDSPIPPWPHDYPTSVFTHWVYAYEGGSVFLYRFGFLVGVVYCNGPSDREGRRKVATFPDMSAHIESR